MEAAGIHHLPGQHTGPIIVSRRLVSKLGRKRRVFCSKEAFFPPECGEYLKSASARIEGSTPSRPILAAALIRMKLLRVVFFALTDLSQHRGDTHDRSLRL
jgi:hypothetical protein